MNLTEEKKVPLRSMADAQKKMMLERFFQSKETSRVHLYARFRTVLVISVNVLVTDIQD